ncbi:MAG: hypothetical protein ACPGU7_00280 [Gammaproteobacteria bacterium]
MANDEHTPGTATARQFASRGFVPLRGFLAPDWLHFARDYALRQQLARPAFSVIRSSSGKPLHQVYGDGFMDSLLARMRPEVERASGLSLLPTFSQYRIYRPGEGQRIHLDRPSCEVAVTLNLALSGAKDWPIWMDSEPVLLKPGDGALYHGLSVPHGRDPLEATRGGYSVQLMLFYVDADGPYADLLKFDARPGLAFPRETRDTTRLERAKAIADANVRDARGAD